MVYASLPPKNLGHEDAVTIQIPRGMSAAGVAQLLHREGLIRDPDFFLGVARLLGADRQIKAGTYLVTPNASLFELLRDMTEGNVLIRRVTIPEGYSLRAIAALLAAEGFVDEERFLRLAHGEYLGQIGDTLLPSLEGYLFPDTYFFPLDVTEETVIETMLRRFAEVVLPHVDKAHSELTLHEIVTLASIVEREARVASERPLIASVYLNRLRSGMPLQADPTVIYAHGERIGRVLRSHLEIDSPYNTYRYRGLPPGPIASPGLASILAVLYPADTPYLYFVARGDGTHRFSLTYEEHLEAVRRYR